MSPSPPFPSPLLPSHSSSSSAHPGIIGEHRPSAPHHYPSHQRTGTSAVGDIPNGEYLLHLLRSGSHVQQQRHGNIGKGGGGGGGGGGGSGYEQHSHYGFPMPGIVPRGGDIPMTAWDPAVAALGPSHSFSNNGFVGGAAGTGDGREVMHGLYPPSPYITSHVSMGSGWPTHKQKQGFLSLPSATSSSSSPSPSLSSSLDSRLFEGRSGDNTFVPLPGSMPLSPYGSHLEMLQRRPEWHPPPSPALHHRYQQQQLRGMLMESDMSPNHSNNRATTHIERGPHQQFFGDGAELMKLLQISSKSTVCADPSMDKQTAGPGVTGSSMQKVSPAIVHGPIGPPKRIDSRRALPADDLLGRFWPAPAVSSGNGSQGKGNENHLKASGPAGEFFPYREIHGNLGSLFPPNESGRFWGDNSADVVEDVESLMMPTFANWEGRVSPRFSHSSRLYPLAKKGSGLPDNFEYHDGRGLLGGWGGDLAEEVGVSAQQYRQSSGGRGREDLCDEPTLGLNSNHHDTQHMDNSSKESEPGFHRDYSSIRAGAESLRGGGGRRGSSSRIDMGGRRGGRSVIGQWVAVHEKQREREGTDMFGPNEGGAESGSEKGGSSTGNSCKEEGVSFAKDGSGSQKCRDELKRRRGQQQEWRMKTPPSHTQLLCHGSSSVTKMSEFSSSSDALELVNGNYRISSPMKIRPLALQVDHPGLPSNVLQDSPFAPGSSLEEPKGINHERGVLGGIERRCGMENSSGKEDEEEPANPFGGYLDLVDERETGNRHGCTRRSAHEEVDYETQQEHEHMREFRRHSHRTLAIPSLKPETRYRPDLQNFTAQMLAMYLSLIPTQEEERKREKFLSHLDQLVAREWPGAILFLFGSCANAFGVCNSDIDVCLSINDEQLSKGDLVLKMAAILRSDNMHNVQALTHARVPIVKFTDPTTGISCDICVNNMLAVVNSKLLHDYSQIDVRLRQLAFLVKHWAKRRQVNETYRGTLSSYAYVLMCIHFLQQRKPAILPCLQEMPPTYRVTLGSIDCAYYDQVEMLQNFGLDNKETLGELLTSFFEYWAFRHDYNRAVVSVRTGGYLSKDEKEWTRRIGNERHLICIEDPLETVHDLGRVVDRHSIRVLRDEFHRAAKILRHDLNPCTTLFEPFIREKP